MFRFLVLARNVNTYSSRPVLQTWRLFLCRYILIQNSEEDARIHKTLQIHIEFVDVFSAVDLYTTTYSVYVIHEKAPH